MSNIEQKRRKVVEEWLKVTEDPFCKKETIIVTTSLYEKGKQMLQVDNPVLSMFKSLTVDIVKADDQYRIIWLFTMILSFFKGQPLKVLLPGNWEDELRLTEIFTVKSSVS